MQSETAAPLAGRLLSLDAYRGFIMLAMVSAGLGTHLLRDDPIWRPVALQFDHVAWEGCVFWDLIQPSFMFMVGVAMPFAFGRRVELGQSWGAQFRHVWKRCFLLILIGMIMDSFNKEQPTIQFIRVLQQIAIGYFLAFFVIHLRPHWQFLAALVLLAIHTACYLSYGGEGTGGPWEKNANFGTAVDRGMHAPFERWGWHDVLPLSKGAYVTFNAISAAATIVFGVVVGGLLRGSWSAGIKVLVLFLAGALGVWGGLELAGVGPFFTNRDTVTVIPLVKRIWTASFAIYAAGWTCWMMLLFYLVIDIAGFRGWSFPLMVVGVNSIFIYFSSGVFVPMIRSVLKPFTHFPLQNLGPWSPVVLAVLVMLVQWMFCWFLYRKRIFLKV